MIDHTQDTRPWYQTLSRYQWLVLSVAWMGWVFDIADTALFNFAKTPMLKDILGEAAYGAGGSGPIIEGRIQMIFLLGWSLGGLIFGVMADRWGRTKTLSLTILLYCAFTGLTAFCQSVEQLMLLRFLTAIGIGGEWAAGAALIAEVLPNKTRAAAAAVLQTAAAVGPVLAALANTFIAANNLKWIDAAQSSQSWRWLFVVGVLPALMVTVIRFKIHEPEQWQTSKREGSALDNFKHLFFHPVWGKRALIAMLMGVVGISGAGAVSFWLPNLVEQVSGGLSPAAVALRKSNATYVLHGGTLLGVLFFPYLCERIGRKRAFALFFVLAPASLLVVGLARSSYGTLLLVAPLLSFATIGLTAGFALYFPELFPTSVRGTGLGFAYNTGRILSAPIPLVTGAIIASLGGSVFGGVAATALIYIVGLAVLPFAPETRGKMLPREDSSPSPTASSTPST